MTHISERYGSESGGTPRAAISGDNLTGYQCVRSVGSVPSASAPDKGTVSSLYPFGCTDIETGEFRTLGEARVFALFYFKQEER